MITVNAMGEICPIPVMKTKKAMRELTGPGQLEVLVDNGIAAENVRNAAESQGASAEISRLKDKEYRVVITVGEAAASESGEDCGCKLMPQGGSFVVVISSDKMGSGNDKLGAVLMKGFIYAVSQLEVLPDKILFYNGGVTLTTEGSESLEDLRAMEEEGVEILSCGTCLDYYGFKDKLAVGSVTNMYTIAESLAQADKVVRP